VLKQIKQTAPDLAVIVMTAYATVEQAVEAMKEGAFDFLTKPHDPRLSQGRPEGRRAQALQRAQQPLQASWRGRRTRSSARAPRSAGCRLRPAWRRARRRRC
jgi:DNA-binding NtrC family response regulator